MAKDPGSDTGTTSAPSSSQLVLLSKIHNLPGVFIQPHPDKSYGGLVSSIQSGGVKEPVVLRVREDGEYQLVHGYRRKRASELAKKQEIPALIYEMTSQEAISYFNRVRTQPDCPIPGKLVEAPKQTENPAANVNQPSPLLAVQSEKSTEKAPDVKTVDVSPAKETKQSIAEDKTSKTEPQADTKEKAADIKPPAPETKEPDKDTGKPVETTQPIKAGQDKNIPSIPAEKKQSEQPRRAAEMKDNVISMPTTTHADKKAEKSAEAPAQAAGPTAKGPAGTQITQVLDSRLSPPDEKALKDIPVPKDGESLFITLHPAYLKKSGLNTISVDKNSENYKELRKSIELNGVKDPVLTRVGADGTLEIVSGQRRHMIASELNYPVPTIIQKIDDADAKIIVADGNLHRDKISTYDLSRALRMKMEGMKQKAGRRKKGSITADELNSDEKLAQEMGMNVSKLNRIIRLSEANKDVCDRVDDGSLALSIASAISFLTPEHQDDVLRLSDLGYKLTNERIERVKKAEKTGKLDEITLRDILDDKDITPKRNLSPEPAAAKAQPAVPISKTEPATAPSAPAQNANTVPIPPSPDVKPALLPQATSQLSSVAKEPEPESFSVSTDQSAKETDGLKGAQERPEYTRVILAGDRLRKYFPDVRMTPREIEESVYDALEERRQRQEKLKQKESQIKKGPTR